MTSLTGSTATLRRRLLGVLTATGLGGATAVVLLSAPAAVGASDPCAASEMARTISNVARSAGDYLDGHPETNQAMTSVMQQPAGPQSVNSLKSLLRRQPQGGQRSCRPSRRRSRGCRAGARCRSACPQVLGFMQSAQGAVPGGLPGGMPARRWISGAQNALPGGARRRARRRRSHAGYQRVQVSRSSSAGGSGPCRASSGASIGRRGTALSPISTSSGSSAFSVRNMKKNTTQPTAASSNQLISR